MHFPTCAIIGGVPSSSAQNGLSGGPFAAVPATALSAFNEMSNDSVENRVQSQHSAPVAIVEKMNTAIESLQTSCIISTSQNGTESGASCRPAPAKARVGSVATTVLNMIDISPTSSITRMTTTIDRIFLNDGLIRVYEGAAEHALKCWITSSNTPYMLINRSSPQPSTTSSSSSSQQLAYWRICELERGASTLLKHAPNREKDIMDAFHSVVLAFAAQWTPSWIGGLANPSHSTSLGKTSENKIRLALWERARDKLQKVVNVDSFRVIFALISFAWTEKPRQVLERAGVDADLELNGDNCALDTSGWQTPAEEGTFLLVAAMRKLLSIKFRIEGRKRRGVSPWNALNAKVKGVSRARSDAQSATKGIGGGQETMAGKIQSDLESKRPAPTATAALGDNTVADAVETSRMEGTYHMLYWLCVIIDTETSVLRKHPPVVCDEDSEIISCIPFTLSPNYPHSPPTTGQKGIWDDYILDFSKHKHHANEFVTSWPSDPAKVAATLAFSTSVKVVMFRQISRLQMSFWRRASRHSVEQHIRSGLSIVYHWNTIYGPLIDSFRASRASLPASIQSWYVLLAFPWYLAILLFVEMVQTVNMAGSSDKQARFERARSGIFAKLRDRACSDLALLIAAIQTTSFSSLEPTFEYVRDSGSNLLLTEPWSEILVHSITAVVKTEIKLHEGYRSLFQWRELDESHARIEKCLWALGQLSDRSPSAAMAREELERLSNVRRRGQYALQQIPMASPPLQRGLLAATVVAMAARQSIDAFAGVGVDGNEGSPQSDATSKGVTSSSDDWTGGADTSAFRFEFVLTKEQDTLQSALDNYFASSASSLAFPNPAINTAPPADIVGIAGEQGEALPLGVDKSADLGHLMQMLEQPDASSQPILQASDPSPRLPASFADAEQLSILETLAELMSRPMVNLGSLNSGSTLSSSSMDTMFSFDLLAALAVGEDGARSAACAEVREGHTSSTCTTESDSDSSDRHEDDGAQKKPKLSHPAPPFNHDLAFTPPPLQISSWPMSMALSYANLVPPLAMTLQESKCTSILLQPPPHQHRNHDDLYTDDDDDDLVSYRASIASRFETSPASSTSCIYSRIHGPD